MWLCLSPEDRNFEVNAARDSLASARQMLLLYLERRRGSTMTSRKNTTSSAKSSRAYPRLAVHMIM
jgi:hypothetical protein